eukprot:1803592-Pleurochrysis_carterae.AAC.1
MAAAPSAVCDAGQCASSCESASVARRGWERKGCPGRGALCAGASLRPSLSLSHAANHPPSQRRRH